MYGIKLTTNVTRTGELGHLARTGRGGGGNQLPIRSECKDSWEEGHIVRIDRKCPHTERGLKGPSSAQRDPEYVGAAPEYQVAPLRPAESTDGHAVHVRQEVADSDPPTFVRRPVGHQLLHLRGGSGRSSAAGRSLGHEPAAACTSPAAAWLLPSLPSSHCTTRQRREDAAVFLLQFYIRNSSRRCN